MNDRSKTKQALIQELASLRERITELDQSESDRKQSKEALKNNEEKYRTILENMQEGYFEVDLAGNLTFFNDSLCQFFGYSKEEFMGMNNRQYTDKENSKILFQAYNKVYNTGEPNKGFDWQIIKKDGTKKYVEGSVSLQKDSSGKPKGFRGIVRDVTQRKQAESQREAALEALRLSEDNFRRSLEDSPLGVRIVTVEGETIYANQAILDIYGYDSMEEFKTTPVENRYTPESFAEHRIRKEKRKRGDEAPSEYEISIIRKDGEVRHLQVFRKKILWDGKKQFQVLYNDITTRKQAEDALQKSEDRFKNLYQESPIPTFTWQKKGDDFILVDFNNAAIQMTNGKIVDYLGNGAGELYRDRPQVFNDMNFCFQERSVVRRKVVSRHFTLGRFMSVHYGFIPPDLIIVHTEDQTDRKQAEEVIRESESKFRTLFESASDAIFLVDQNIFIDCNLKTLEMFGCTREQIIGQPPYRFSPEIQPDGRRSMEKAREKMETALRGQKQFFEWKHSRYDGTLFDAEVSLNNYSSAGKYYLQAIIRDITDRKRAEEQLHASLQEKELLLREVHHRVKNNMQVISGLLALQARSAGNPELTGMLNESQSRIHDMSLVHEKLYGSKDFARIDLPGYVKTMSQDLFQTYKINPGKIDLIILTDGDVYVDINKAIPCSLILNELISNALKHAFLGDRHGKLQIILREKNNTEIEIIVCDDGLGLPDDVDIHQPRSVGLHLVNGLVKNQLGGQIEIRRDAGTEFRIKFPL